MFSFVHSFIPSFLYSFFVNLFITIIIIKALFFPYNHQNSNLRQQQKLYCIKSLIMIFKPFTTYLYVVVTVKVFSCYNVLLLVVS